MKTADKVRNLWDFYWIAGLSLLVLVWVIYATITRPVYVIPLWVIYILSCIEWVRKFVSKLFKSVGYTVWWVILVVLWFLLEYRWVFFLAAML